MIVATEVLTFRVAPEMRQKIEALAAELGCGISDVIRIALEVISGISAMDLKAIETEAKRRRHTIADLIEDCFRQGWYTLDKTTVWNVLNFR
jgi:antitoxin component of RelBE/YafQ-DinJ toxin-antitoxin module